MLKNFFALAAYSLTTFLLMPFASMVYGDENCLGVPVYLHPDSAVYQTLHPWIDTAADSAHFPIVQGDCASAEGCSLNGFYGTLAVEVNRGYSQEELIRIQETWSTDLNANFQLQRIKSYEPLMVELFKVDSAYNYQLGPNLWVTKEQILALSKKCYIGSLRIPFAPNSIRAQKSNKIGSIHNAGVNINGRKVKRTKEGQFHKMASPEYPLTVP